jgi:hypothetical protein
MADMVFSGHRVRDCQGIVTTQATHHGGAGHPASHAANATAPCRWCRPGGAVVKPTTRSADRLHGLAIGHGTSHPVWRMRHPLPPTIRLA